MENEEFINEAGVELQKLELVPVTSEDLQYDSLLAALSSKINDLINNNFSALVQLLYSLDIHENKLKELLKQGSNSSAIIAQLIMERQIQKIKTRKSFIKKDNIPDDEKW
jgi:hypothetical protein